MMKDDVRRTELYSLLGDVPARDYQVSSKVISEEATGHYTVEKLLLDLNGIEQVPTYFVRPKGTKEKTPVILFNHSHGGNYHIGKNELLESAAYMYPKPYAEELTACGYSVLCIDTWGFGERRGRTESELFKEMLWKGQVLWGMMVFDSLKAIDYLETRPDVDLDRIGTLGMSMGSTMAWWTAALDKRIKVCVDICCLTDFDALIDSRGLDSHSVYYYVPNLLKSFSSAQINSLISPRPRLSLNGIYDRLTPAAGLDRIDGALKEVYEAQGAEERYILKKYPVAHLETAEMRSDVMGFLKKWL